MHVMLVGPEFEENLSLRYLAAALVAAGHSASLARFDSLEHSDSVIAQALREQPGIVGLSMVFQVRAREFMELARSLKRAGFRGQITAGGHFATFAAEELLKNVPELDSIIRQEGEETLVELAGAIENGAPIREIPGIVVRLAPQPPILGEHVSVFAAARRQQVGNLDSLPFPIRDEHPERHLGIPTAFMVGSRGCYADCEYCSIFAWHEAAIGKRYRLRSPANIADEMAGLYSRGVRFFVFHDDNFFLPTAAANRKRFEALKAEIDSRGIRDIGLMLKLRPNDCDRDNMLLLKEMGLLRAFVGIENASARQLRSLGRDSTVEDVEACLALLRELDIYATYNILLFDPYTRLEDVAMNLRFLRANPYFPFNWCKVEPYAGTELEKRYMREGRLRGDYLGYDYEMDDPRVRLMYDILLPAFRYRNYDYYGLANTNIGLGYHRQLLRHFYPNRFDAAIDRRVQQVIERINGSAIDLLERTLDFVSTVDLADVRTIEGFSESLKEDSFRVHGTLGEQAEAALREIERAAGVRIEGPVGVSEAFTPLNANAKSGCFVPQHDNVGAGRDISKPSARRRLIAALAGGFVWLMTGCRRQPSGVPIPSNPPSVPWATPSGEIHVAPGYSGAVAENEPMMLEAVLQPASVKVLAEPRVTTTGGKINSVHTSPDKRALMIEYQPEGGSRRMDPNVSVSVAWTIRGEKSDTVIAARASIHLREQGGYAFGFETPRPTIAEMAAPPISQGPKPGGK